MTIIPTVKAMSSVELFGFVCGAKGTWCPLNDDITQTVDLKNLGITMILQKVLCDTTRMLKAFMAR